MPGPCLGSWVPIKTTRRSIGAAFWFCRMKDSKCRSNLISQTRWLQLTHSWDTDDWAKQMFLVEYHSVLSWYIMHQPWQLNTWYGELLTVDVHLSTNKFPPLVNGDDSYYWSHCCITTGVEAMLGRMAHQVHVIRSLLFIRGYSQCICWRERNWF